MCTYLTINHGGINWEKLAKDSITRLDYSNVMPDSKNNLVHVAGYSPYGYQKYTRLDQEK